MTSYKVKEGIIRTKICNVQLLVPTRKASETCPHVMKLNLLSSIIWETIEKDMPMEKAFQAFKILLKEPDDEIHARMQKILDHFCENGFLISEEEKCL